ncbi:MAG: protein-L-isoaspartate(D-aspartate) O-methyltransferase [Deltaproteobacteria bacterium]
MKNIMAYWLFVTFVLLIPAFAESKEHIPQKLPQKSYEKARGQMVENQLRGRDIQNEKVLKAFLKVPRELFVRAPWKSAAYDDNPLPIGEGQTISQPYVVALMTEVLNLNDSDKVLEIGTGSGYQAAILSEITKRVYSIEIRASLSQFAKTNLENAGYANVKIKTADGYDGWTEHAPFDAIMITAAANHIPPPLKKQLKIGGRLILPLGSTLYYQSLVLVTRRSERQFDSKVLTDVRFVPMIGKAEMQAPPKDNNQKQLKKLK